jgi:hypothetical protein
MILHHGQLCGYLHIFIYVFLNLNIEFYAVRLQLDKKYQCLSVVDLEASRPGPATVRGLDPLPSTPHCSKN